MEERAEKKSWPVVLLLLLLATDLVLIGFGAAYEKGWVVDPGCSLNTERGYAELFQYTKAFWAALVFAILLVLKRRLLFGVAAVLFAYLLVDDSMRIHETVGLALVEPLGLQPAFGLRAIDFGEIIVSTTVGGIILMIGALAYLRGGAMVRRVSLHLLIGLVALAACGIGLDMAHSAVMGNKRMFKLLGLLEDGGELIVFSFFAWYAYGLLSQLSGPWNISMHVPNGGPAVQGHGDLLLEEDLQHATRRSKQTAA